MVSVASFHANLMQCRFSTKTRGKNGSYAGRFLGSVELDEVGTGDDLRGGAGAVEDLCAGGAVAAAGLGLFADEPLVKASNLLSLASCSCLVWLIALSRRWPRWSRFLSIVSNHVSGCFGRSIFGRPSLHSSELVRQTVSHAALNPSLNVSRLRLAIVRRRLRRYEVKLLRFGAGEVDILEDGSDGLVSQVADVEMEYGVRNVASLWYNGSP
ncbi:hypothetical protein KCV03_g194, partial [Aureobasidium melanogenum]